MNPVIHFIKNHLCLIHQNPILKYIHHFHQPLPFPLSQPHLPTIIVNHLQLPQLLQSPLHRHFHLPPLIHHLHHNHSLNLNLLLIFIPCKLVPNLEFSNQKPSMLQNISFPLISALDMYLPPICNPSNNLTGAKQCWRNWMPWLQLTHGLWFPHLLLKT